MENVKLKMKNVISEKLKNNIAYIFSSFKFLVYKCKIENEK
jgi:hypothetical protein